MTEKIIDQSEAEEKTTANDENTSKNDEKKDFATENGPSDTDGVEKAIEKLNNEKEGAKNKEFADPIIGYLKNRVKESPALATEVLQNHKTWNGCYSYIFKKAKAEAHGSQSAAYANETVFEWAEDYFHQDDKAQEEKRKKDEADKKKRAESIKSIRKTTESRQEKAEEPKPEVTKNAAGEDLTSKKREKAKEKQKGMDGQMDLFAMFGMEG